MLLLRKLLKLFFPPFSNSKHVSLLRLLGTYLLGRCICTPLHRVLFSHKMNVNRDKKWEWSNVTNSDFTPLFLIFLSLQQRQRRREVKEERRTIVELLKLLHRATVTGSYGKTRMAKFIVMAL